MPFTAYVICATQRSGSTLLCDLLTASAVAGDPDSYFRSHDVDYWAGTWGVGGPATPSDRVFNRDYLAAMTRAGTANTGIFGLRLVWDSLGDMATRLTAALGNDADVARQIEQAFGPTLFIHLSRENKLAQAVSLVRAKQTGLWHVDADGAERERTGPPQPPIFDAVQIARARDTLIDNDAGWPAFFTERNIHPLRLTYETLAADPQAVLEIVLAALGRDETISATIDVRTAKLADATSTVWVERMTGG